MPKMLYLLAPGLILSTAGIGAAAAQEAAAGAAARLDHVAIWAADQQKSVDFYKALFGLQEIPAPFAAGGPRWFLFSNGVELHIQPGRNEIFALPKRVHMAIAVASLDPVIAYLDARKMPWGDIDGSVRTISRGRKDGVLQIFFQDPDGYWIELNNALKPRATN